MSLRNFVSSYPQLSVNAPPPHHQTHRVQALPVSVATALQQQMNQQQSQANQQSNGGGGGSTQAAPSHEYHVAQCLPFQAPGAANIAPNFIRHMSNGAYQPHPQQNHYQTQGGPQQPPQQQQPNNPAQSIQNSAPTSQTRLNTMAPPTAPPTPPTQQQQQPQPGQQPQYAVAQGGQPQRSSAGQYRGSNPQNVRRPQQPTPPQYIYSQPFPSIGHTYVIPGSQIRHAVPISAQAYPQQVFQSMQQFYYPPAPSYQQMAAPTQNGQRQPGGGATQSGGPPSMGAPTTNEYSSYSVYDPSTVMQPVMQQQQPPAQVAPPPPKTAKKPLSKALVIINPATGKSIFDDDDGASATTSTSSTTASSDVGEKVTSTSEKEGSMEKESGEPSTPVVSAMSDGPSVDITPKHTNKIKKTKPPEVPAMQLADPPKPIKIMMSMAIEKPEEIIAVVEPSVVTAVAADTENNNGTTIETTEIIQQQLPTKSVTPPPVPVAEKVTVVEEAVVVEVQQTSVIDTNDTNNNNYQKESDDNVNEDVNEMQESDETDRAAVVEVPQDSNNNMAEADEKPSIDGPIDYDDDQWSPANLAGKKYYTRDQLLKLKDAIAVPPVKLPDGVANTLLKNNKEYLTNTLTQQMPPMGMRQGPFDAITPKFMPQINHPGGRNPYPKRPSQPGMQQKVPGRGGSQSGSDRKMLMINLSLHDNVKLNEAENAWKPSHLQAKAELNEEEKVTYDVLSKFRSMLNKLTAENFEILLEQVKTYKIDTTERLDGVISLLFEKAISEPKFAPTYANLCKKISDIQTVPTGGSDQSQDNKNKKNTLKVRLITQCQKEFERNKEDTVVFRQIEEKLRENENEPHNEKREEQKALLEEEHYRLRQRANGTVKFIGELYKIDMLTSKIMRTCIEMLLTEPTEEKVERVCKLLTTIGGKMEHADGRQSLNKYFINLNEMTHLSHKIIKSSRIKFEIQNLEDLRNNNWKARRQDLMPKTMNDLQWEAEQEQQMINYQTRQNAKEDRQRGGQGGYKQRQQPQQDSDGWSVQQTAKSRTQPIQLKNISLPMMSDTSAKLGNASQFQNFMMQTNKFAGLLVEGDGSDQQQRYGNPGSKNSSMERGDRGSRFYGNGGDNRYGGRGSSNQGSRNSSQIRSRDNSGSRGGPSRSLQAPPRHQQPPASSMSFSGPPAVKKAPSSPVLTEDEVEKMLKELVIIVDDYKNDKLTLEAAMEKSHKVSINKDVLLEIYNKFLDRKEMDRENLMMLIVEMLKQKKIMREDNKVALMKVMELAPEFACDVPRVYEYIAHYMSELLIANVLTFQEAHQICQAEECNSENVLRFIFTACEKRHGANTLQRIVADSNCDLGQFTKDGNFGRWLEVNKFTSVTRRGAKSITDVMAQIKKMLTEKCSNDSVMEYISSTDCSKDPTFIRQLTTVVMECCCDEYVQTESPQMTYKLNTLKLEPLSMLLQRYNDNVMERELQCIYALQNFAFVREYPPGFLNSIFDILYDNDVLSADAFEKWKSSEDQTEGKGVAVCSTRQFFTKLAEEIEDDDEDDTGSN